MGRRINNESMLPVGTVLSGRYRIDRYLSSGGFGNTYVATNIKFGNTVAVKEFFINKVSQREQDNVTVTVSNPGNNLLFTQQLEKFNKEAQRIHAMSNPHIVAVLDLFDENGTAYYVMDYIDGQSVAEMLSETNQPMSEKEVRHYLPQLLDALQAVHNSGFFHLDLKPGNIMIDKSGKARLIDFGASKQEDREGGAKASSLVCYTEGYAPIEQCEQNMKKFGPWTDIYALGATLYSMLTNDRPPKPTDIDDDRTPDKSQTLIFPQNVSANMRTLILWMMQLRRTDRPQNVREILDFLRKEQEMSKPLPPPVKNPSPLSEPLPPKQPATKPARQEPKPAEQPKRGGGNVAVHNEITQISKPVTMPQQATRPGTRPATRPATGTAPLAAEPKSGGSKKGLIIGGVIAALLILGGIIFALSSGGGDNNGASDSAEGPEVVNNVVTTGPPVIVVRFVGEKIEYYKLGNDEGKYVILEKDTEYKAGSEQENASASKDNDLETLISNKIFNKRDAKYVFIAEQNYKGTPAIEAFNRVLKNSNIQEVEFYNPRDYSSNRESTIIEYATQKFPIEQ